MIPNNTDQSAVGWVNCRIGDFTLETDWLIETGEISVLFGASGSGKTTTLRAIAGLIPPIAGYIRIGGRVVYDSRNGTYVPTHRRHIAYLTQQYHLFPHLTAAQNIGYGLANRRTRAGADRVAQLMSIFRLEGLERRRTWELSGGQQQRVALARALAPNPSMLLLDEPFASLDMELRRTLRLEIRSMLEEVPMPVMLVTHDREEALALGDSVQVLDDGRPVARGNLLDVLGQPGQSRLARLVGVENLFHLHVESRNHRDGTMICSQGDFRIEVPLDASASDPEQETPEQDDVLVGVRASDIILASHEVTASSARNRVRGRVVSVELQPPGYEVSLDCGQVFRCHITGAALEEMGIQPGMHLWAVFKASSCFLVSKESRHNVAARSN